MGLAVNRQSLANSPYGFPLREVAVPRAEGGDGAAPPGLADLAGSPQQAAAGTGPFDETWPEARLRLRPAVLGAVFVGGCAGGLARFEISQAWPTGTDAFPWATFTINSCGAFLLALLLVLIVEVLPPTTYVRPLLATGFCGAWTTFSSIVAAADQLVAHDKAWLGATYVLASAVAGLASAMLGLVLGRSVAAIRSRQDECHDEAGGA